MLNNTAWSGNCYAAAEHCYISMFLDTQIDKFPKVVGRNFSSFKYHGVYERHLRFTGL